MKDILDIFFLMFLKNINYFPFVITLVFEIFLSLSCVYFVYKLCKQYIFDGADFRSPFIISVECIFFIIIVLLIVCLITSTYNILVSIILNLSYTTLCLQLLNARLLGYQTMYIPVKIKSFIAIIANIIFVCVIATSLLFILPDENIIHFISDTTYTLFTLSYEFLFIMTLSYTNPIIVLIILSSNMLFSALILVFDIIEKRSKDKLKIDIFGIMITLLLAFINKTSNIDTIIFVLLRLASGFSILLVIFFLIKKEVGSILLHAKGINVKVNTCINTIDEIYKKMKKVRYMDYSRMDIVKMTQIANICRKDLVVKEAIYTSGIKKLFEDKCRKRILGTIASFENYLAVEIDCKDQENT